MFRGMPSCRACLSTLTMLSDIIVIMWCCVLGRGMHLVRTLCSFGKCVRLRLLDGRPSSHACACGKEGSRSQPHALCAAAGHSSLAPLYVSCVLHSVCTVVPTVPFSSAGAGRVPPYSTQHPPLVGRRICASHARPQTRPTAALQTNSMAQTKANKSDTHQHTTHSAHHRTTHTATSPHHRRTNDSTQQQDAQSQEWNGRKRGTVQHRDGCHNATRQRSMHRILVRACPAVLDSAAAAAFRAKAATGTGCSRWREREGAGKLCAHRVALSGSAFVMVVVCCAVLCCAVV